MGLLLSWRGEGGGCQPAIFFLKSIVFRVIHITMPALQAATADDRIAPHWVRWRSALADLLVSQLCTPPQSSQAVNSHRVDATDQLGRVSGSEESTSSSMPPNSQQPGHGMDAEQDPSGLTAQPCMAAPVS